MSAEQAAAVQASPEVSLDIELPLQTFVVNLPTEPILLNDRPFRFAVNQEPLVGAVNYVNEKSTRRDRRRVDNLRIVLGESLPPKIAESFQGEATAQEPEVALYKLSDSSLVITLPEQLVKKNTPTELLKKGVENSLNDDLRIGFEENIHFNNMLRNDRRLAISVAIGGPLVGEAVALGLTNEHGLDLVGRAVEGNAAGVVVAFTALVIKARLESSDYFKRKAEKRAQEGKPAMDTGTDITMGLFDYFQEPIITLVEPAREEG
jgi:hypothetical protein